MEIIKSVLNIDEQILSKIIDKINGSIRETIGIGKRVNAYCQLHNISLPLMNIDKILLEMNISTKKPITQEILVKAVAGFYKVEAEDILGLGRKKVLIRAKRMLMYLLREVLRKSLREIGKLFGNTGHTNALQNLKRFRADIIEDPEIRNELNEIRNKLEVL
jgi:chromosomal replication initiator protein